MLKAELAQRLSCFQLSPVKTPSQGPKITLVKDDNCAVFVRNIPSSWTSDALNIHFQKYGTIIDSSLKTSHDSDTQQAVIHFSKKIECTLAITSLNERQVSETKYLLVTMYQKPTIGERSKTWKSQKRPCSNFIFNNCTKGHMCPRSHTNCLEIKECPCCNYDVIGRCKAMEMTGKQC